MYLYEIEQQHKKIPIILLEEPENHLFLRNQISLSNTFLIVIFFAIYFYLLILHNCFIKFQMGLI